MRVDAEPQSKLSGVACQRCGCAKQYEMELPALAQHLSYFCILLLLLRNVCLIFVFYLMLLRNICLIFVLYYVFKDLYKN